MFNPGAKTFVPGGQQGDQQQGYPQQGMPPQQMQYGQYPPQGYGR